MLHDFGREEGAADRRRRESVVSQEYVPHIHLKFWHYLTCGTNYVVAGAEDPEEIFGAVLGLPDNTPEKADLLDKCGFGFLRSILGGNTNRKEDIDNSVLAYESAVHLTPLGHSGMSSRFNRLGVSLYLRFERTGDLEDISSAISYQQKAVHLTPEGHVDMIGHLNNLGNSFQSRFQCTGDIADISNVISYQQKVICLTPEGHADMPGYQIGRAHV